MKKPVKSKRAEDSPQKNDNVWNDWNAYGSAVIYLATPNDHEGYAGEYMIDWEADVSRKELRGYRETRKRAGRNVPKLKNTQLKRGLFIVMGAELSPLEVVTSLTRLIKEIKRQGMLIGKQKNGDYMNETIRGKIE